MYLVLLYSVLGITVLPLPLVPGTYVRGCIYTAAAEGSKSGSCEDDSIGVPSFSWITVNASSGYSVSEPRRIRAPEGVTSTLFFR